MGTRGSGTGRFRDEYQASRWPATSWSCTCRARSWAARTTRSSQAEIKALIKEGHVDILLNLSKVNWINSTGLGILVSAFHTLKKNDGRLKICEVSDRIDNILNVTQLKLVFDTFDTERGGAGVFPGGAGRDRRTTAVFDPSFAAPAVTVDGAVLVVDRVTAARSAVPCCPSGRARA